MLVVGDFNALVHTVGPVRFSAARNVRRSQCELKHSSGCLYLTCMTVAWPETALRRDNSGMKRTQPSIWLPPSSGPYGTRWGQNDRSQYTYALSDQGCWRAILTLGDNTWYWHQVITPGTTLSLNLICYWLRALCPASLVPYTILDWLRWLLCFLSPCRYRHILEYCCIKGRLYTSLTPLGRSPGEFHRDWKTPVDCHLWDSEKFHHCCMWRES